MMAWNSILFHQYFCLSLWDSYCPYCEKLRSTRSLIKTKATVSFGLTLQPGPCAPKSCTYRCDLLFNASFQNSKPLRHFPFINQKQGTQKSVGFLFSNENHTKVWTDLNCLMSCPPLGICASATRGERRCSRRRTASIPAVRQPSPRNSRSFVPDKQEKHQPLNFIPLCYPVCVGFSHNLIII